ncbi:hypothetical protein [Aneurinibacillus danicus]|uniref:Uncharacterized protein n=1 Tax=Aneurinibacillus danicus TaxID=267746 RepID=A0A511VCS1_9BACL|nr:hypothetical protein [Aneurinibacillus danicus]GEN36690.1 hypothetical protein ADA01nite_41500 [Aneurinibacillus danicus]
MGIQDQVEKIKQMAEDSDVLLFEVHSSSVQRADEEELPKIKLVSNEKNLQKLFRFSKVHSVPLFLYQNVITQEDINDSIITKEDIEQAELDDEDPEWTKLLKKKVQEHNKKVKTIECDLLFAVIYTVLPSQVVLQISFLHEKFDEWVNLLDRSVEDLLEDTENESLDFYEKKEEKKRQRNQQEQQTKEEILKKWEEYLLAHPEFQFQTNQNLRRIFVSSHRQEFIDALSL